MSQPRAPDGAGDGARYGVFVTVMSRVSTCMPSITRQASTHTAHVRSAVRRGAIGTGSGRVEVTVAQSLPSASTTCVPRTTVPSVTGVLPVLVKPNVTSSHQACPPGLRRGSPMTTAGEGDGEGVLAAALRGVGAGSAVRRGDGDGDGERAGEGEGDGVGLGVGEGSSGTNSTPPVGGTAWDTSGPAAPVAT